MKLGIISDTHDRLPTIAAAFTIFADARVDHIVHCGDWTAPGTLALIAEQANRLGLPVSGVIGNRDNASELLAHNLQVSNPVIFEDDPLAYVLSDSDISIGITHGHQPSLARQLSESCDVIITGHSHKPLIEQLNGKLYINPGSTAFSIPRRREARSVALYDTASRAASLHFFDAA